MKRRGLSGIGCCLLVAFMALSAGCEGFLRESARTSIADFFTTVLSEAVNSTIAPQN